MGTDIGKKVKWEAGVEQIEVRHERRDWKGTEVRHGKESLKGTRQSKDRHGRLQGNRQRNQTWKVEPKGDRQK